MFAGVNGDRLPMYSPKNIFGFTTPCDNEKKVQRLGFLPSKRTNLQQPM